MKEIHKEDATTALSTVLDIVEMLHPTFEKGWEGAAYESLRYDFEEIVAEMDAYLQDAVKIFADVETFYEQIDEKIDQINTL